MRETVGDMVHDVDVEDAVSYLEDRGYDEETGSLEEADRVVLVESPDVTDAGIELRFLCEGHRTPYTILDVEEPDNYEVLLE